MIFKDDSIVHQMTASSHLFRKYPFFHDFLFYEVEVLIEIKIDKKMPVQMFILQKKANLQQLKK